MLMAANQSFQWTRLVIPGPMDGAPMEVATEYEAVKSEADEVLKGREFLDTMRSQVEEIGTEDGGGFLDLQQQWREGMQVALSQELKFRNGPLTTYLDHRRQAEQQLHSERIDAHEKLLTRVRKDLEKIGYDMDQPRQAALTLQHPEVVRSQIAKGSPVDDASRNENGKAIESLTREIERVRTRGFAL